LAGLSSFKSIRSRFLPERSRLVYRFATENGKYLEVELPFFENIRVEERQSANLESYKLLGRPGNIFAYMGADSRSLSLEFSITLPHLNNYFSVAGYFKAWKNNRFYEFDPANKKAEKKRFYESKKASDYKQAGGRSFHNYYSLARQQFNLLATDGFETDRNNTDQELLQGLSRDARGTDEELNEKKLLNDLGGRLTDSQEKAKTLIDYYLFLINIVRSSTLNNSQNPSYGPPLIYLNHGTMYRNIPCVCTDFSIKVDESAGFDVLTLTPNKVDISLNLKESRTGDYDDHSPFDHIKGENVAGWESIIEHGTLDPFNSEQDIMANSFETRREEVVSGKIQMMKDQIVEEELTPWASNSLEEEYDMGIDSGGGLISIHRKV